MSDDEDQGDSSVDYVVAHWDRLPPHVREAIVTLVDATVIRQECDLQRLSSLPSDGIGRRADGN